MISREHKMSCVLISELNLHIFFILFPHFFVVIKFCFMQYPLQLAKEKKIRNSYI